MSALFSLRSSWELLAAIAAVALFGAAMYQFIVGQHYMIPTAILAPTFLFANLARRGFKGERWAKYVLYWFGVLMSSMAFMGIFMAGAPKEKLGALFLPAWGAMFLLVAWLTWQYGKRNELNL